MHAQLITYKPAGIDNDRYAAEFIEPFTEYFAGLDTLVTKVWFGSPDTPVHGGFYVWQNKEAMDAFMSSDAAKDIMSREYITELTSQDWPVNVPSSIRSRGLSEANAV
ncbi:YdhR family protein [Rhodococcus opacus]|uniref:YdhR family protein n=1 Tax=Rhodococcus opacus TaxID=37919 RepID=UPI002235FC9D|nr:YdhR family protein [Rhodococcus opacus]UZG60277.1 YdhR family protein [Rhodococcus opacus]